ncbi:DEAD/DEAH box helicase family protein [Faecalicatena contorta]|uniref:DEAD/DEAH box helicase family protein n=1 Tax=Faecalicatena contorta TaxID=39482 RepID=UPI001960EA19|nr:DEAD/DEAH box helicase family protein [Faecalicatena contorta]MBM6684526.1 DEAD/DEAH box helicase family protein [Faecalicatena contorta]MBM6709161.1 DEAD/DEAH box helicase family protein [Faecalicatena contorta]
MKNIYEDTLQFRGTWRDYQDRVLSNADKYLADGKVHIVAAPGSGKTTLGIELIRRLGAPCLILSPGITIRQQWLERIVEGFLLPGRDPEELLSNDLKNMKTITAITYQALYSAMKRYQGRLADSEGELTEDNEQEAGDKKTEATDGEHTEGESEDVDFRDFDILEAVRAAGIRTICLDEAHHLRSEWWKALEKFMKELKGVTVIALTATPPYDSTPGQWKRYIDLCGPIDEEIFTPELVKEGSLCPHEDYIFFNWPAREELRQIEDYQKKEEAVRNRLLTGSRFTDMIATHRGLRSPEEYSERFLDNPKYFSALLIFCQTQQIPFPAYLRELIGAEGRLPRLDSSWLEVLLQGFLYDDTDSYEVTQSDREELLRELKEAGCIYRKKVSLTHRDAMQRLLAKSQGKMESIGRIVDAEYSSLGEELRLLVLCDYIKKDKLSLAGTDQVMAAEIGAVPIFEHLRRQGREGVRLGCLSGSVILVPMDTREKLEELLGQKGCQGTLSPVRETGYGQLKVKGKNTHIVAVVTELFRQGEINVLVGTKSLLGEGWDAPCINSLVLATYVGSFMLSNQMRGRTIRTDRDHPEKTGNIWHLACIFPEKSGKTKHADFSGDYETLVRRFHAFLGVSWKDDVIESGVERLAIPEFDTKEKMEKVNEMMLERASDREGMRSRWQRSLREIRGGMEVQQVEDIPAEEAKTGFLFVNAVWMEILSLLIAVLMGLGRVFTQAAYGARSVPAAALGLAMLAACVLVARYGVRLVRLSTPERRMTRISQAVADALAEIGELEDPQHCRAQVESADGLVIGTWLKGGTMRDKTTFAACMEEIWGVIDNPRYLLTREKRSGRSEEFYSVPEIFGNKKERALVFEKHMRKVLGRYQVAYTRTPEGRRLLLRARTKSFVNKNQSFLQGRKVAKGKYE